MAIQNLIVKSLVHKNREVALEITIELRLFIVYMS